MGPDPLLKSARQYRLTESQVEKPLLRPLASCETLSFFSMLLGLVCLRECMHVCAYTEQSHTHDM